MTTPIQPKTVAIIGAGPAGLFAAKECIACGLIPTVFEKNTDIGGLWAPGSGATWNSLKANISKYSCGASDFPFRNGDLFPTSKQIHQWLHQYADHFQLKKYILLNARVTQIAPTDNQWEVKWIKNNQIDDKRFSCIMICSGFFSKPYTPNIPGITRFIGPAIHAMDYKTPAPFKNKVVVVIGNAFSGCEIAAELAKKDKAKKVIHVAHRHIWVLPRNPKNTEGIKLPLDMLFYKRAPLSVPSSNEQPKLEISMEELNTKKFEWLRTMIPPDLLPRNVNPKHPQHVSISDDYYTYLRSKKIVQYASIQQIEGNSITVLRQPERENEDKVEDVYEVDAIIFCTGFSPELPFFSPVIQDAIGFQPDNRWLPLPLYKTVFPSQLSEKYGKALENVAFIGYYRGPFFSIMELAARLAAGIFSKKLLMISPEELEKGVDDARHLGNLTPRPQFPYSDYVGLCDDLAKLIGAFPNFSEINDEELERQWINGPVISAWYRLTGLGNNPKEALKIIKEANKALQNLRTPEIPNSFISILKALKEIHIGKPPLPNNNRAAKEAAKNKSI